MKRIRTTVGQERQLYRSLNHVERRHYWQHIHNPSTPKVHRYFRAVWRARLRSMRFFWGDSISDVLKKKYDKLSGKIVYDNSAFLRCWPRSFNGPQRLDPV
jgi:hypothetical protein